MFKMCSACPPDNTTNVSHLLSYFLAEILIRLLEGSLLPDGLLARLLEDAPGGHGRDGRGFPGGGSGRDARVSGVFSCKMLA